MSEAEYTGYRVQVLGCKVNQYDAQQICRLLELSGARSADAKASVITIIHSCGVTATGLQKSLQAVRRAHKQNPAGFVIMTGCCCALPEFVPPPEAVASIAPHEGWLHELCEVLNRLPLDLNPVELPAHADEFQIDRFSGHTRAFLKIQNGCNIGCSYCIVPSLRGYMYDKPLPGIVREARRLVEAGHKEIIVSGVSVGLYGRRGGDHTLADVMRELAETGIIPRLRLSSLHPDELSGKLIEIWSTHHCMLPHIHLPLQSGSDRILKAMKRSYNREAFRRAVELAKEKLDCPAITTDVIVGFPGETEGDFKDTMNFCRDIGFSRIHVFPFSPRPGTAAENLQPKVPGETARERSRELRQLAARLSLKFYEQFIGAEAKVLVERWNPGTKRCSGYTEHYIPVEYAGSASDVGKIKTVSLDAVSDDKNTVVGHSVQP